MKILRLFLIRSLIFLLLTIVTQVGGIIYLLALLFSHFVKISIRFEKTIVFVGLYLIATFIFIPVLASMFSRERVKHSEMIKPANYMTVLLNRNYVDPRLNKVLESAAIKMQGSGTRINYLDANFPFFDNFPMLPHLSHDDGKKLDLSFVYENHAGKWSKKQVSVSGYGVFEDPKRGEVDTTTQCLNRGYFYYDYPKYLSFGRINRDLQFSSKGTKKMIIALLRQKEISKLFIEPHLKRRLGLRQNRIRYQGCWSVRHDDHIHIQL